MYKAVLLPLAKQDIKEAVYWYESRQTGLGKRFSRYVREKVKQITKDPYLIAVRYDEVRTAILDVFPFMIHYIIDEATKSIIITAVLHMSQNPDKWKGNR